MFKVLRPRKDKIILLILLIYACVHTQRVTITYNVCCDIKLFKLHNSSLPTTQNLILYSQESWLCLSRLYKYRLLLKCFAFRCMPYIACLASDN